LNSPDSEPLRERNGTNGSVSGRCGIAASNMSDRQLRTAEIDAWSLELITVTKSPARSVIADRE
jgi:hypothetical protein